jgi:hypothetical protein
MEAVFLDLSRHHCLFYLLILFLVDCFLYDDAALAEDYSMLSFDLELFVDLWCWC